MQLCPSHTGGADACLRARRAAPVAPCREAGADLAGVLQVPVRVVEADGEGANAAAGAIRRRPAEHEEVLPSDALTLSQSTLRPAR